MSSPSLFESITEPSLALFSKYYLWIIGLLYLSYFLVFFGLMAIAPSQMRAFSIIIQFCVSIYLILRFHPFKRPVLYKEDVSIIFGSAILLLINLGITEIVIAFYDNLKNYIVSETPTPTPTKKQNANSSDLFYERKT